MLDSLFNKVGGIQILIAQFLKEGKKLSSKKNLSQSYSRYYKKCTIDKRFYYKLNKEKGSNE